MTNKTENILMRVTKEQKDFIKNKTEELGYRIDYCFLNAKRRKSFSFEHRYEYL